MNRWTRPLRHAARQMRFATYCVARYALLALTLGAFSSQAVAQTAVREFPRGVLRGTMVVTQPPEILMDRKPDRLSPGARIRGPVGMLVMSGAIVGQELVVNYVRDTYGLVHEVWILTPEEIAVRRPGDSGGFRSGPASGPPVDNGNRPFDQLPRFGAQPAAAPLVTTPNQ